MKLVCWLLAASMFSFQRAAAAYDGCADDRATYVPANDVEVGTVSHCDLHISLFGIPIVIDGPECHETIYHFPAHGWCNHESNPGTHCVEKSDLRATVEHCQCGLSLFGVHVLLPICTCSDSNVTIPCPDAGTAPCPILH